MIGGVLSQRISQFLPPLGSEADSAKENSFVPTHELSFAEQIVDDFGAIDDDLFEVWKLHDGRSFADADVPTSLAATGYEL